MDAVGISEIIQKYQPGLVRYVGRWLPEMRAREVVQDTFMKLTQQDFEKIKDKLGEWLYTVSRNRAMDVLKKDNRITWMGEGEEVHIPDERLNALDMMVAAERKRQIDEAIDSLPESQKICVIMKFQDGLSYKEISDMTGHSINYVGVLIHTGMIKLRKILKEEESGKEAQNEC